MQKYECSSLAHILWDRLGKNKRPSNMVVSSLIMGIKLCFMHKNVSTIRNYFILAGLYNNYFCDI